MGWEINTEKLINSVKKRPALYDKHQDEYSCQPKKKMKIWEDVCKEVYSNWDTLRPQAKFEHFTEIQKRWKSLRTCFSRELAHQKRESKAENDHKSFKKRKIYEYFNHLKFLMGFVENKSGREQKFTFDNDDDNDDDEDPLHKMEIEYLKLESSPEYEILYVNNDEGDVFDPNTLAETVATVATNGMNPTESEQSVRDKLFDILNNFKNDENNEDRLFLLSLLPCFARLEPKKKLEAKIEILKLLKNKTE